MMQRKLTKNKLLWLYFTLKRYGVNVKYYNYHLIRYQTPVGIDDKPAIRDLSGAIQFYKDIYLGYYYPEDYHECGCFYGNKVVFNFNETNISSLNEFAEYISNPINTDYILNSVTTINEGLYNGIIEISEFNNNRNILNTAPKRRYNYSFVRDDKHPVIASVDDLRSLRDMTPDYWSIDYIYSYIMFLVLDSKHRNKGYKLTRYNQRFEKAKNKRIVAGADTISTVMFKQDKYERLVKKENEKK